MTTVFHSCLPGFYSHANQSLSSDNLSCKTNSNLSLNNDENSIDCCSSITINENMTKIKYTTNSMDTSSSKTQLANNESNQVDLSTKVSQCRKNKNTKKRGPCYSRINEQQKPLLKRLVGSLFGGDTFNSNKKNEMISTKKKRLTNNSKKSVLPSKSILKRQYDDNEKTLRSLVTLLTQIESNIQLPTNPTTVTNQNLSIENEQARNNNRLDDSYSSHSNDSYYNKSKSKHNHPHAPTTTTKHYTNARSTRKHHSNKNLQIEDDNLSCSSIISHSTTPSSSTNVRRTMIDNQQQTQIYPTKSSIATSTQINHVNDLTSSEPSWLDVMREDQTTINAWSRIRRRLKPNQQKDILRALMIICANLFEVPIENKQI